MKAPKETSWGHDLVLVFPEGETKRVLTWDSIMPASFDLFDISAYVFQ